MRRLLRWHVIRHPWTWRREFRWARIDHAMRRDRRHARKARP